LAVWRENGVRFGGNVSSCKQLRILRMLEAWDLSLFWKLNPSVAGKLNARRDVREDGFGRPAGG
jgi:hypothetical protein